MHKVENAITMRINTKNRRMKLLNTLRSDLNKTLLNIGFAGAVLLTFLLCFTAPAYTDNNTMKSYSVFEALFSLDREFIRSNIDFASGRLARLGMNGYVTLFLPIIVAFPFMVSFCAERNNGNIRFVIARTGKLRYYISKFVSCFLCGGLAVLIGISLYMCAMYMLFPPLSSYNANEQILETYRGSGELWENIKYCISSFLNGAIATMPAFFLSSFCKNPYIITCIPFMLTYVWQTIMTKLINKAFESYNIKLIERLEPFNPCTAGLMFDTRSSVAVRSVIFNCSYVFVFLAGFIAIMSKTRDKGT